MQIVDTNNSKNFIYYYGSEIRGWELEHALYIKVLWDIDWL